MESRKMDLMNLFKGSSGDRDIENRHDMGEAGRREWDEWGE